jgi:TRAP-type C4-dicarboxylate transport system permease small subunit
VAATSPRAALSPLDRVLVGLNILGALLILALLVLINRDALGRTFFSAPVIGVHELVELSIVAIVFLQLGDAVRIGRLTRSDGLLMSISRRLPPAGRALRILFDLLAALFMGLIVLGAGPKLISSIERGEFAGTAMLFTAPEWPVRAVILLGAVMAGIKFLAMAWAQFRRAPGRS